MYIAMSTQILVFNYSSLYMQSTAVSSQSGSQYSYGWCRNDFTLGSSNAGA